MLTLATLIVGLIVCIRRRRRGGELSRYGLWFFLLFLLTVIYTLGTPHLVRQLIMNGFSITRASALSAALGLVADVLRAIGITVLIMGIVRHDGASRAESTEARGADLDQSPPTLSGS